MFDKNVNKEYINLAHKDIYYNLQNYFKSSCVNFDSKTITYTCMSFL